ncbi:MAG: ABC transporter substrate-binding protein [Lachnospiraceae bacterium]|nr:ABC transporter substrate-binding protein [Lachnospiraceae bacterium]
MKRKIMALLTALTMTLSLTACAAAAGSDAAGSAAEAGTAQEAGDVSASTGTTFKVGICNYVDDASLNQIVDNIESRLEEIGTQRGVNFKIEYDNCNADSNVLSQIIANFIADEVDLMVGVATPVAMSMQGATEDNRIPVVFAAVSDPVGTGVVESMEAPGANITGTSDQLDTEAIMNLILAQNSNISKVGLLYDVGQDASTAAIAQAKEFLESRGIEYVEHTGTSVDEISLAADAFISDGVEAIFTPSDNTVMTAELTIYEKLADAGILHYAGADSFALNGAFLGYGVDYANLGAETAEMVAEILLEGKDPASTSVRTFDNGTATINTDICGKLGLSFNELSETFAPYCTKVESITTAESFE